MNFAPCLHRYQAALTARKLLAESMQDFACNALEQFANILSEKFNINPCFLRIDQIYHDSYGNYDYIKASLPLNTMVRQLIDGEANEQYLKLLEEHDYSDPFSPQAMAFCSGIDDNSISYRDPAKNMEYARKKCPEFPEDFQAGRKAGKDMPTPRFQSGFFRCDWLVICMDATENDGIDIRYQIASQFDPDFNDDFWKYIDADDIGDSNDVANILINNLCKSQRLAPCMRP